MSGIAGSYSGIGGSGTNPDGIDSPSGSLAADSTQTTLGAITLSVTGAVGASSYLWSAVCSEPPDSSYTSTAAPASASSASTSLTPDGPGDYVIACELTGLGGSTTLRRLVTVTRPRPAPSSTLGAAVYMAAGTYAPTLSETAGADGTIVWATSCTKVTDGSSVSVTGSATTTPTITIAAGTAYRVRHRCTDGYGRVTDYVVSVSESSAGADDLTLSLSTGATVAQASPGAQAITATATGGTGSKTYAWSAKYQDGSSANALLSATNVANPTLTTTDYAQRVIATCTATDSGSPAQVAVASVMVTVSLTPIVFSNPAAQTATTAGAAEVTFATASGGIGTLTTGTATLARPAGSSAAISGSGYGPYSFTTDTPGTYAVTQSVTDTIGQSSQATGTLAYAPTGPTWTQLESYDWTTVDSQTTNSAGTIALLVGGAAYKTLNTYTSGAVSSPVWHAVNGSGIKMSYATGNSGEMWFDFLAATPSSSTQKIMVQWIVDAPTYAAGGAIDVLGRISDAAGWNGGAALSSLVYAVKPANYILKTDFHSASTPSESTVRDNAADITWPACVTIIEDGYQITLLVHQNCTDFVNPDSVKTGAVFTAYQSKAQTPSGSYTRWITVSSTLRVAMGHLDYGATSCYWRKTRVLEAPNL